MSTDAGRLYPDCDPYGIAERLTEAEKAPLRRLRRVLEPDRAARDTALVRRDAQGYRLAVPPHTVDSHVLTAATAAADVATYPAEVLRIADDALPRWRGTPYDGLPDPGLEPVRTRLAEVRLTLHQHRLDALLATGHPDRAVGQGVEDRECAADRLDSGHLG